MKEKEIGFIDFFSQLPDHRLDRRKLHPVEEILLVTFCGMIAGCDSWEDLELFGKTKIEYLRRFYLLKKVFPATIRCVVFFGVLDSEIFVIIVHCI